jgi:hypothetical protein
MTRRQTVPQQWLILDRVPDDTAWTTLRRLPREAASLFFAG